MYCHIRLLFCVFTITMISCVYAKYDLRISKQDLSINVNTTETITIKLNAKAPNDTFDVKLSCSGDKWKTFDEIQVNCDLLNGINQLYVLTKTVNEVNISITGAKAGRTVLVARVNNSFIDTSNAFTRINVIHSRLIDTVSLIVGWIYFFAWSISFYPQLWTNFSRKSVVGLNFDFLALNITGFLCYSLFNAGLYFSPLIQSQYELKYPRSQLPVAVNDVVFALHASFATFIVIYQCIVYEKGTQTLSPLTKLFVALVWSTLAIIAIIVAITSVITWLTYLYYFSYVKLLVTFIKYIPQALYNFRRKSTIGWSIGNILLDFTGGVLSLAQMFLIAYNYDDWQMIENNLTKFGLGVFSILFDLLFIVQHYVLYRHSDPFDGTLLTTPFNRGYGSIENSIDKFSLNYN